MLIEDFSEGSADRWAYTSDRVMGGVSTGEALLGRDGDTSFARLEGEVSTANNGGFIQLRQRAPLALPEQSRGLVLRVRGNGERYYIHLQSTEARRPWQYHQAAFDSTQDWQEVRLPWEDFRPQGGLNEVFALDTIRSLGIVAYGRDHRASLDVDWVRTYD